MKRILIVLIIFIVWISSCKHELYHPATINPLPVDSSGTGVNGAICFEKDILPIFHDNCANASGCHSTDNPQKGYILDTYENIIKKGIDGQYRPDNSTLYNVLKEDKAKDRMPMNSPRLEPLQIERIAQWITDGAKNTCLTCDSKFFTFKANVLPIIKQNCTNPGCHHAANASAYNGVELEDYAGIFKARDSIRKVIQWLPGSLVQMPKGSAKLDSCSINTIVKWIDEGALLN
jgi:hypothetical protein